MESLPPLSVHRLNRLLLWARVWLSMAQRAIPLHGRLAAAIEVQLAQRLAYVRTLCLNVLFLHAMARIDASAIDFAKDPRAAQAAGIWRKAIGSQLRRRLKQRTIAAQIDAVLDILHDREAVIERLVRRLKHAMAPRPLFAPVRESMSRRMRFTLAPLALADTS